MFRDFITLLVDFIQDFIRMFNKTELYVHDQRPKTYGTKIKDRERIT